MKCAAQKALCIKCAHVLSNGASKFCWRLKRCTNTALSCLVDYFYARDTCMFSIDHLITIASRRFVTNFVTDKVLDSLFAYVVATSIQSTPASCMHSMVVCYQFEAINLLDSSTVSFIFVVLHFDVVVNKQANHTSSGNVFVYFIFNDKSVLNWIASLCTLELMLFIVCLDLDLCFVV